MANINWKNVATKSAAALGMATSGGLGIAGLVESSNIGGRVNVLSGKLESAYRKVEKLEKNYESLNDKILKVEKLDINDQIEKLGNDLTRTLDSIEALREKQGSRIEKLENELSSSISLIMEKISDNSLFDDFNKTWTKKIEDITSEINELKGKLEAKESSRPKLSYNSDTGWSLASLLGGSSSKEVGEKSSKLGDLDISEIESELEELRSKYEELEKKLETVRSDLEDLKVSKGAGFYLEDLGKVLGVGDDKNQLSRIQRDLKSLESAVNKSKQFRDGLKGVLKNIADVLEETGKYVRENDVKMNDIRERLANLEKCVECRSTEKPLSDSPKVHYEGGSITSEHFLSGITRAIDISSKSYEGGNVMSEHGSSESIVPIVFGGSPQPYLGGGSIAIESSKTGLKTTFSKPVSIIVQAIGEGDGLG